MALVQKIILCILTVTIALVLGVGVFSLSMEPNFNTDIWLLIPVLLCVLSVFSFVFHLKTISFYRDSSEIVKSYKNNIVIWSLNVVFGVSMIMLAFFFAFQFSKLYDSNIETEFMLLSIIVVSTLLIGIWICLDYYSLLQKFKNVKSKQYINQIDEITGNESD